VHIALSYSHLLIVIKLTLVIAFLVLGPGDAIVYSQGSENTPFEKSYFANDKEGLKNAIKELQKGNSYHENGVYSKALPHLLEAHNFNPNNAELNMKIGHCYLYSSQKQDALSYLQSSIKLDAPINSYIHFLLGHAYHLKMEWDSAITEYGLYINQATKENNHHVSLAKKKIDECNYGKELVRAPLNVKIENLGEVINSKFAEYHPIISADESVMYFTSRRENTTGGQRDLNFDVYFEDVYRITKNGDSWSAPRNLNSPVNTEFHDATVGLAPDGQKLFIYKDDEGDGNIYVCELDGNKWTNPEKLNENVNSEFTEPTACFSYDGRTMYFVSNRPGGFGKSDIYVSKLDDVGDWGPAANLGAAINTQYNEDAIFMHPDGKTLYFSSEGHKTMGGYDLFKSVYDKTASTWSTPENLGFPINSTDNDAFFVLTANGEHGYYSSIKPEGLGEKDLYMVTFLDHDSGPELTLVKGKIIDKNTGQPIEADIEVIDKDKNEVVANAKSNKLTGEFLFSLPSGRNYGVTVTADGYFFHSEHIDIPESSPYYELFKNITLDKIDVGKSMVLNYIFFDFNKATLRSESIIELERVVNIMKKYPKLKIEISGHTDNKGTAEYNQKLSEQRAISVVKWLKSNGIGSRSMVSKGYGFSQPVASNETEEGQAKNRRTEFKVLEFDPNDLKKSDEAKPVSIVVDPEPEPVKVEPEIIIDVSAEESEVAKQLSEPQKSESLPSSQEPAANKDGQRAEPETQTAQPKPIEAAFSTKEETTTPIEETTKPKEPFATDKINYYASHPIPVDPVLPEGVVYRIQVGSFSRLPNSKQLKGLYPVMCNKLPNGLYRCSVGMFRKYAEAKEAQKKVRAAGFSDAFLISFYNGKKISVSKAVNMQ